jgi:hypothetical protein
MLVNVQFYFKEGSIYFAASNNSLTAAIEISKFFFSSSSKSNSITFSIPFDPITAGTPA